MALPTCPKCRQSVLDDDAESCPFCGASMSGKGAAPGQSSAKPAVTLQRPVGQSAQRPAAQPQSRPAPAAAKQPQPVSAQPGTRPAQTPPQTRPATATGRPAGAKARPSVDEMLDDKPDLSHAIPISKARTPKATEKVTCPMCDATGYLPPQAFGRDVKCPNPDCIAPVFTAPVRAVSETPNPTVASKKKRSSGIPLSMVISISTLVAIIALGISWFIYVRKPVLEKLNANRERSTLRGEAPVQTPVEEKTDETKPEEKVVERPPQQAIDAILNASAKEELNRSKPYCVRLAAYVFALEGNQEGTTEQITRLTKFSSSPPHYQIEPLTQLAWNALKAGDKELAETWLNQARETVSSLGSRGRGRFDLSIPLAAACIAAGDLKTAEELVAEPDSSSVGQLASATQMARSIGTFDIHHWLPGTLPGGWYDPQRTAVTVRLVTEGEHDAAVKWIAAGKSPTQQFESVLAYLETDLLINPSKSVADTFSPVQTIVGNLSLEAQAGIQARLGWQELAHGKQEEARKFLQTATDLFARSKENPPLKFSGYEEFLEIPLPDMDAGRLAALSAADIARLSSRLGEKETAIKWLKQSESILRGISLSREQVFSLNGQINGLGTAAFQRELKSVFHLKTDDQARRRADEIVRKVNLWRPVADRRFELQFAIYSSFQQPELKTAALAETDTRSSASDTDENENYQDGSLRIQLDPSRGPIGPEAHGFYLSQDLKSVNSQLLWNSRQEWENLVDQNKENEAISILRSVEKADDSEYWLTWEANRLVAGNRAGDAFRFIGQVSNINHREELMRLIAAQAVVTGQRQVAWEAADSSIIVPTVKIAGYTGILEGLRKVTPATAEPPAGNP